jgi:type II restriction/modification system DNA methylase subunit YeeA
LIGEYSWSPTELEKLDKKLKKIKIVDPACGSGAFLNKAADVLLEIHNRIFDIKMGYTKTSDMRVGKGKRRRTESVKHFDLGVIVFDAIEKRREILLNNIFGVDLNGESVEITKLALFLKVCKKGLKLPNLDNNIKVGNSVIDDPEYAGEKVFNWEEEFPEIFKFGGFDLVIGNPPYVRHHGISSFKSFLKENYQTYTGLSDLYVYFFEKGLKILKNKGLLGYISSNKFIRVNYGKKLRKFILINSDFVKYVDYTHDNVFKDATTYPGIFILKKGKTKESEVLINNEFKIKQSKFDENAWSFERKEIADLNEKLLSNGNRLKEIYDLEFHIGVMTGYNSAFFIDKETRDDLINDDSKSADIIKPLIRGRDVKRWNINYQNLYLIFSRHGTDINKYPAIKKYLKQFEVRLTPRNEGQDIGRKPGIFKWYEIQDKVDYYKEFEKPKLVYREIAASLFAVYDDKKFYPNAKCFTITSESSNLKYLAPLLSSKTLNFVFKSLATPLRGHFFNLSKQYVEQLPIYPATHDENSHS